MYSEDKIYRKLRDKYKLDVSRKLVKELIDSQFFYQVNRKERKPKKFNTVYADRVFKSCQMDIMDYTRYEYYGYKYIFCFIDVYSRYGWAFALTNHRTETILDKMTEIFDEVGMYPENINCDLEFNTDLIQSFAKKHNIKFHFSEAYDIVKNAVVERWNRTIAGLLQKYRTATKKYAWNKYLPDIIYNYNHTFHKTIQAAPVDVFEGKEGNYQPIYSVPNKFKAGDKVRIIIHKTAFTKGDLKTYSDDVYVVEKVVGNKVYLLGKDKSYKPYELQKTSSIVVWDGADDEEELIHEETQKKRKDERVMNDLNIDQANVVEGRRKRKSTRREDEYEYE